MFVEINNKEMNIFEVDKWINTTRDANGGVISPEFAMEILSKTNHFGHIKKVLKNIKDNCDTSEELMPYKEFILSCVDAREMSEEAYKTLQEMAKLCGCEDELESTNKKAKFYDKTDCNNTIIVKSKEEFLALEGEGLRVFFDADVLNLYECDLDKTPGALNLREYDLSKIAGIKFREGAKVDLSGAKNLPKDLDVSMCSKVCLRYCDLSGVKELKFREGAEVNLYIARNLPKDLDFSQCSMVDLTDCDLDGQTLKFREGADVSLQRARNLPKDLDISQCSRIKLEYCDLDGIELKFREGAEVYLHNTKNLQKDLDLSQCCKVDLTTCFCEKLNLKFREGSEVDLSASSCFSEILDFSQCSKVGLRHCSFNNVKEIKFGEGAEVDLFNARLLPEVLDFSQCSKVDLRQCILDGVKEIKFKDKKQEKKFMEGAMNFSGKVIYEEKKEKEDNSLFSRIKNRFGAGGMGE